MAPAPGRGISIQTLGQKISLIEVNITQVFNCYVVFAYGKNNWAERLRSVGRIFIICTLKLKPA